MSLILPEIKKENTALVVVFFFDDFVVCFDFLGDSLEWAPQMEEAQDAEKRVFSWCVRMAKMSSWETKVAPISKY